MTEKTRLYLMRHGQVEGHEKKRYNGQNDVSLTEPGRRQALELAERLRKMPLAAVYASDLSRCVFGALAVAEPHGLQPVLRVELRELHIGKWQGLTWDEIQSRWPHEWQVRLDDLVGYQVEGGESLRQMAERVRPVVAELIERHRGEEIAIVAHGGVNRVILLDAIGAPLERMFHIEQNYGCLNIIDYWADGNATVQLLNG
ncbi:alpha-ribazole phosphatase/probable phosphoglycerate mutase [Geothermobacter ehrlichii]|uniref:Alpha-ribazole phosphatase n=1 Tax=Geothermobacter ehrlichii TaxID=213224 RepID=A0A5D3WMB1_9BACT|nr:alpha-ribazole phosphatase [Geothermobacter ehrlichii]TYO98458.1 alpha-ribazole phosphatase/probable phosphoglycerate mutase [Geothermobacter ehrlichii]